MGGLSAHVGPRRHHLLAGATRAPGRPGPRRETIAIRTTDGLDNCNSGMCPILVSYSRPSIDKTNKLLISPPRFLFMDATIRTGTQLGPS